MIHYYINNNSDTPIYQQLYKQIESYILKGDLAREELLPSIRTMAKELRISIITVKKTWEELEHNGYIYTVKGKGSYVKNISSKTIDKMKDQLLESLFEAPLVKAKELNLTLEEVQKIVKQLYI
jgi:GntR family transcriptional regulator